MCENINVKVLYRNNKCSLIYKKKYLPCSTVLGKTSKRNALDETF